MSAPHDSMSRRDLLKSGGTLAMMLSAGCTAQEVQTIVNDINNRPVRRNIANLAPNDPILQTYAEAITKMKALPASDPRNWNNQALIHYNHCPHNNWWLLPWHRWYLSYFERICQKLTGNQTFALPYWNWTTNPAVPDVFWNTGSPLYDGTRMIRQGTPIPAEFVGHDVLEGILSETDFQVFGSYAATSQGDAAGAGELEATPHNNVHTQVGGPHMGTFMSPLDPLFWTHHAMVDFCWVDWDLNRGHADPNDTQWQNLSFSEFCDENGNAVNAVSGFSLLLPIIAYQYEPSQIGNTVAQALKFSKRSEIEQRKQMVQRGGSSQIPIAQRFRVERHTEVSVRKPSAASIAVDSGVLRAAVAAQGVGRVFLTLGGVQPPAKADFFVRVFVNAGAGLSAETPISDPHYAGSIGFFVGEHGAHAAHGPGQFNLDITNVLRRLNQAGSLSVDHLDVGLVAVPYPGRTVQAPAFSLERLEAAVRR